jgi:arylsulfatase A-like enzyme
VIAPLLALAALAATGCQETPPPARSAPPAPRRVLLVTLDTTRADRLGCQGRAAARTPFLDRMAGEGVRFARAWAAAPITLPSHATILTGAWPSGHGVRDNGLFVLGDGATTLAEALHARGFATGAFVGSFVLDARFGLAQGFDLYRGPAAAGFGLKPEVIQRPAGAVVDDALRWIDSLSADASFFAWVHFYDPHAPHAAPAPFDRQLADAYDGEIASCDAELARLRARLDERGFAEGLLEIVTADHGEGLGEHHEETHGMLLHDATMRVPLLLRGEGIPAGLVVEGAVTNAQVAPTTLRWLGLAPELLPDAAVAALTLSADASREGADAPLLLETFLPFHLHRRQPLVALVGERHKLVRGRFDELFDLDADPGETKDLAGGQEELAQAMGRRLEQLLAAQEQAAAARAPARAPTLTEEERAQLRALGYGTGSAPASGATAEAKPELPDPREAIVDDADQQRALALVQQARDLLGQDAALARGGAPTRSPQQLTRGRKALEEARALLAGLATKYPRDPSIAFDLGNVELSAGRPADAVPRFELTVLADPASSTNHYNLAVAYAGSGEPRLAIAEMEKALSCEPRFVLAGRWLVMAHEKRDEIGRAAWWLDRMVESGALGAEELAAAKSKREQLANRLRERGESPTPSPTFPPKDLRPERLRAEGGGR